MRAITEYSLDEITGLPAGDALDRLVWAAVWPDVPQMQLYPWCSPQRPDMALLALSAYQHMRVIREYLIRAVTKGETVEYLVTLYPNVCHGKGDSLPLAICRAIALNAWWRARSLPAEDAI